MRRRDSAVKWCGLGWKQFKTFSPSSFSAFLEFVAARVLQDDPHACQVSSRRGKLSIDVLAFFDPRWREARVTQQAMRGPPVGIFKRIFRKVYRRAFAGQ